MSTTTTPEAWTKEFDEELKSSGGLASAINPMGLQVGQIKSFIRLLLLSERQRIVEKVEGLKLGGTGIGAIPETNEYAVGWNDCRKKARKAKDAALDDALAIINQENNQ